MPQMVVNCAVKHPDKRCFLFEKQQGDVEMKVKYAGS